MNGINIPDALRRALPDYFLLLLFVAALPVSESLKNIGLGLYFLVWLAVRVRRDTWGGPWMSLDTVVATYLGLWLLAALGATVSGVDGWKGLGDLKYAVLFWLVTRSGYSLPQIKILFFLLSASTLIALGAAFWRFREGAERGYLSLPSAPQHGDTNIYLLIVLVFTLTWILSRHAELRRGWLMAGYVLVFVFSYGLIEMQSRMSLFLLVLAVFFVGLSWAKYSRRNMKLVAGVLGLALLVILSMAPTGVSKFVDRYHYYGLYDPRIDICKTAGLAWLQRPVFGYGLGNFKVAMNDLRKKFADRPGYPWLFPDALDAHNLYLDTLVRGGVTAFIGLLAALGVWLVHLVRTRHEAYRDPFAWVLWTTSATVFVIVIIGGMTNRLLRGEPALLIALLLGIWCLYTGCRVMGGQSDPESVRYAHNLSISQHKPTAGVFVE